MMADLSRVKLSLFLSLFLSLETETGSCCSFVVIMKVSQGFRFQMLTVDG
jgi:hypothetical protein